MKSSKLILIFVILIILIFVILILFCSFVCADLRFDRAECFKDGSLEVTASAKNEEIDVNDIKISARHRTWYNLTLSKFDVNGTWDRKYLFIKPAKFIGEEAQINEGGFYDIILEYNKTSTNKKLIYELNCPGLIFSCEFVGISIKNCTTVDNKYFNLLVELKGIDQSVVSKLDLPEDITYKVAAEYDYEDIKGLHSDKGSLPKYTKISKMDDDLYLFSKVFENNNILSINMFLEDYKFECDNDKLYDYKECTKISTTKEGQEETKEIKEEKTEQKEAPKITGDIIKINEPRGFNKIYLIFIVCGLIIISIVIFIIKKQKVNKWV